MELACLVQAIRITLQMCLTINTGVFFINKSPKNNIQATLRTVPD